MSDLAMTIGKGSLLRAKLFAQSFAVQWLMFTIPALYLLTNAVLFSNLSHHGVAPVFGVLLDLATFAIPCGLLVALVLRLLQLAIFVKPESPVSVIAQDIKNFFTRPVALINGLPIIIAMIFYNKAMIELKPEIPFINPFKWDQTFMQLDRTLHFGFDPWRLLQPFMGYDIVTFISNIAYDFWFVALFGSWVYFAFQKQASVLRTRFFFSYMLIWWIGGGLLAVYFSSAGPVYYGNIGLSPDPFAELMTYLRDVNTRLPIWSLDTQALLWDGYLGKADPLGISAFPSMHNGSAILFALAFRHVSKFWGKFFAAYAALILVTSVHLGWHYAVDGYAAIVVSVFCWWLSGPIARFVHAQPFMQRYNKDLATLAS
jgi:PAP2 superfamily